jgi:hypothetical protein
MIMLRILPRVLQRGERRIGRREVVPVVGAGGRHQLDSARSGEKPFDLAGHLVGRTRDRCPVPPGDGGSDHVGAQASGSSSRFARSAVSATATSTLAHQVRLGPERPVQDGAAEGLADPRCEGQRRADAEVDPARCEGFEHQRLLGDDQRVVVRQHDAARAQTERVRPGTDGGQQDRWRRTTRCPAPRGARPPRTCAARAGQL